MTKYIFKPVFLILVLCSSLFAAASEPLADKSIFDAGYPEQAPTQSLTLSFKRLGVNKYKLDGINNTTAVDLTNRLDKMGKKLTLNF